MATLRVFVSSTCVDLDAHRFQLRGLLTRLGYEPVMSEYSDVLYDHRLHTHTSCVNDIVNSDMVVLIIGSRFGGAAIPDAISAVDLEILKKASSKVVPLTDKGKLSITQVEVLKAIELNVPLFVFVDAKVMSAHHLYQKNKDKPFASEINYPPIDKPETASYIFEFINFVTHRFSNNAITSYNSFNDIESHLLKQWSMLFQRLLREDRDKAVDSRRADVMIEQIQDLKAVVLQSISSVPAREVARSVLRFRRLADFLLAIQIYNSQVDLAEFQGSFDDLLSEFGVVDIRSTSLSGTTFSRINLIKDDGTYFRVRVPDRRFQAFSVEWKEFSQLDKETKLGVLQGVQASDITGPSIIYNINEQYDEEEIRDDSMSDQPAPIEVSVDTPRSSLWNDAMIKLLIDMWEKGATASHISEALGGAVSRNAVIGKAHRIGLSARPRQDQEKISDGDDSSIT